MLSNVHVLFVCLFCSDSSDSDSVDYDSAYYSDY